MFQALSGLGSTTIEFVIQFWPEMGSIAPTPCKLKTQSLPLQPSLFLIVGPLMSVCILFAFLSSFLVISAFLVTLHCLALMRLDSVCRPVRLVWAHGWCWWRCVILLRKWNSNIICLGALMLTLYGCFNWLNIWWFLRTTDFSLHLQLNPPNMGSVLERDSYRGLVTNKSDCSSKLCRGYETHQCYFIFLGGMYETYISVVTESRGTKPIRFGAK